MANGDEPELPDSADANDRRPQLTAIEERVDRLERELAALQRQIAGAAPPQAIPAPPPPLRPSLPRSEPVATPATTQRLTSEAWASARPRAASVPESRDSLESRLGSQVFNRVAIVLLLIGTALGMKLAVDRGLIGPTGRVILGLLAGAALVLWSERFRRKGFAAFSYSLKAVGSGVLYLSLWAAFRLYGLLPAEAALGLMILVTAWNAFMAWVQNSELLAMYALAGGFATPMLLSTGGNHEIFLFTYLLAIDAATVVLVRLRNWPRLLIGAFPLTVIYFIGWYAMYFAADALTVTATFVALFAAAFAAVSVGGTANDADAPVGGLSTVLGQILLPLGNAAFAALALYFVLENSGHHAWLPWLMLVLAAAYLGLMRLPQTAVASAIHLSLAVVFLTIAIPLKASGAWITASWLVEGLALLWVATRLGEDEAEAAYALRTLRGLGAASLALGFCGVCFHLLDATDVANLPLWNNGTGAALTAVAVFTAAAWLSLGSGPASAGDATRAEAWARIAMGAFLLIAMTAALLTLREVGASWTGGWAHPAFATTDFAMAILALAIFAGLVAISLQLAKERLGEDFWMNCAALSTIAFNLVAVLTGVREVAAVWSPAPNAWSADAALQQALAISSFLMLYGAALLAVGFWRRSGFLRWQALVLLVFTIFKTFLYDMRDLSQGYRVVSFLGLGALLLAISFAYQKDWLNLRKSEPAPGADSGASK